MGKKPALFHYMNLWICGSVDPKSVDSKSPYKEMKNSIFRAVAIVAIAIGQWQCPVVRSDSDYDLDKVNRYVNTLDNTAKNETTSYWHCIFANVSMYLDTP